MAKVVGDVAITVGADVGPLARGMARGARSVRGFESSARRMSVNVAAAAAKTTVALAAITVGVTALTARAAGAVKEIDNLAKIAGVGVEEFQRYAIASDTVGISQEKLSDILKDVNDRVGDFLNTGAGPMADFFENIAPKVGVTIEQFARLSGPEALQLYVSSLEKAGASQQEMTFYMEALASDATALIPLLRESGAELNRLGDAASDAGQVMSRETVEGAARLDKQLTDLADTMRAQTISALIALEDELALLFQFVQDYAVPALESLISGAAWAAEKFYALRDAIQSLGGNPQFFDAEGNEFDQNNNLISRGVDTAPSGVSGPAPLSIEIGDTSAPLSRPGRTGGGSRGGGSRGGGRGRNLEDEFEALRDQFRTEQEIIQENYETQMAQLEEFRAAKLEKESEYNDLEQRIKSEHEDKMAELETQRRAAMLDGVSSMFGDLSSLMSSGNEKIFKIGKAAAIAEAIVNGYKAATDAWAKGMAVGGPGVAAAFTAASLARTGALIAGIKSTQMNGGSGGGGGGGGVPSTGAQGGGEVETSAHRIVNVSLRGNNFGRDQLVELLNEVIEDGATVRIV